MNQQSRPNMVRQGDILLERIDAIPKSAKARKSKRRIVLAEGESSGHAHTVSADQATAYDDAGVAYLEVQEAMAMLTHEEHAPIALERGVYRMTRQREFQPSAPVQVRD